MSLPATSPLLDSLPNEVASSVLRYGAGKTSPTLAGAVDFGVPYVGKEGVFSWAGANGYAHGEEVGLDLSSGFVPTLFAPLEELTHDVSNIVTIPEMTPANGGHDADMVDDDISDMLQGFDEDEDETELNSTLSIDTTVGSTKQPQPLTSPITTTSTTTTKPPALSVVTSIPIPPRPTTHSPTPTPADSDPTSPTSPNTTPISPTDTFQSGPFPCPHCPRQFTRAFNLKTHLQTHDQNRPRPFPCTICPRSFVRIHDLIRHESVHTKRKGWHCPECGTGFTRRDALRRHAKVRGCGSGEPVEGG
ncbi:hypothetical protein HK097_010445, partial [Rhizophlyctis rosea]